MTTFLFQASHILMVLNEINSLVVVQCTYTGVEISLWGDDRLVFTPHLKFLFIDKYGDHISTLLDTHTARPDYIPKKMACRATSMLIIIISKGKAFPQGKQSSPFL